MEGTCTRPAETLDNTEVMESSIRPGPGIIDADGKTVVMSREVGVERLPAVIEPPMATLKL